jgi:SAM-dependent methyltransferase
VAPPLARLRHRVKADLWKRGGRIPGAYGSGAAKWLAIENGTSTSPNGRYGWDDAGLDERVVEYPWLFERMMTLKTAERVLDAGSVLNHPRILARWRHAGLPPVSIVTLGFEGHAEVSNDVRYEFADLRSLPYRDEWFPVVLSLSTLEHVGLDNAIYGAAAGAVKAASDPDAEVMKALRELHRVTKRGGTLLLSVPFGARSNRGWFRLFDPDDVGRLLDAPGWMNARRRYFRQRREGWRECAAEDAKTAGYNEPAGRPGQQTAPPFVAAAEAVALIEMTRA